MLHSNTRKQESGTLQPFLLCRSIGKINGEERTAASWLLDLEGGSGMYSTNRCPLFRVSLPCSNQHRIDISGRGDKGPSLSEATRDSRKTKNKAKRYGFQHSHQRPPVRFEPPAAFDVHTPYFVFCSVFFVSDCCSRAPGQPAIHIHPPFLGRPSRPPP